MTPDQKFSVEIRERDNWICTRCGANFKFRRDNLHCSHFHSRRHQATRYDPKDCDAVCYGCHRHWEQNRGEYEDWKRAQLGDEEFEALDLRHRAIVKRSDHVFV